MSGYESELAVGSHVPVLPDTAFPCSINWCGPAGADSQLLTSKRAADLCGSLGILWSGARIATVELANLYTPTFAKSCQFASEDNKNFRVSYFYPRRSVNLFKVTFSIMLERFCSVPLFVHPKPSWSRSYLLSFQQTKPIEIHHVTCYLLSYYLLTYSMEQSPFWETNRFSASQEILRILWNPKVYFRIQKFPPPVPILNKLDPVHTTTSYFLKIHLSIILQSTPGSLKWLLSFRFPHQNPVYASPLPQTLYMPCPSQASCYSFFNTYSFITHFWLSVICCYLLVLLSHVFQVKLFRTQCYDLRKCVKRKHYRRNEERTA